MKPMGDGLATKRTVSTRGFAAAPVGRVVSLISEECAFVTREETEGLLEAACSEGGQATPEPHNIVVLVEKLHRVPHCDQVTAVHKGGLLSDAYGMRRHLRAMLRQEYPV